MKILLTALLLVCFSFVPNMFSKVFYSDVFWLTLQYIIALVIIYLKQINSGGSLKLPSAFLYIVLFASIISLNSMTKIDFFQALAPAVKLLPLIVVLLFEPKKMFRFLSSVWIWAAVMICILNWIMTFYFMTGSNLTKVNYNGQIPLETYNYLGVVTNTTFYITRNWSIMRFQGWAWEPAACAYFLLYPLLILICDFRTRSRLRLIQFAIITSVFLMTKSIAAFISLIGALAFTGCMFSRFRIFFRISTVLFLGFTVALLPNYYDWLLSETSFVVRLATLVNGFKLLTQDLWIFCFGVGINNDNYPLQTNSIMRYLTQNGFILGTFLVFYQLVMIGRIIKIYKQLESEHRALLPILVGYFIFNLSLDLTFSQIYMLTVMMAIMLWRMYRFNFDKESASLNGTKLGFLRLKLSSQNL